MAERRIHCSRCASYDRAARRCRMGKSNPKSKLDSMTLAETLGPGALCLHNPYREPLLLRMRFPDRRFVWAAPLPPAGGAPLSLEWLDDDPAAPGGAHHDIKEER